ncbi:hypothetical protein KEM54_005473 [Ascosphaera aggregata]|nr:hypothetical protein KEM54_005473 [Ascosphaera aggregata]
MKALSLDTPSALEALVTEAIYLDLISAKMSPASNPAVIHVTATAPMRDIRPETMTNLLSTLDSWQRRCQSAASDLHKQIEVINRSAEIRHREDNRSDQKIMSPVMYKGKEKDETKREILKPLPQVSSTRANGGRASEAQQERADSAGSQMDIDYDVDLDNLGAPL